MVDNRQCRTFTFTLIDVITTVRKNLGSAEIWTRIAGFRVQSANRYTTEPLNKYQNNNGIFSIIRL